MKNYLFFILTCILFVSCDTNSNRQNVQHIDGDTEGTSLVTLTVNGESHEFVMYKRGIGECRTMGISHWPSCKYCKIDSIN